MRSLRQRLGLALTCVMLTTLVGGFSALPVGAAAPEIQAGSYRSLDGLEFDTIRTMQVSEAHNRITVAGDDRVEIYSLDQLDLVALVEPVYGALDLRINGNSAFVAAANTGVIYEIALLDGTIVNQWATEAPRIATIDVDNNSIWLVHDLDAWNSGLSRIDRASGDIQRLGHNSWANSIPMIRVSRAHPDEFYLSLLGVGPAKLHRYRLEGDTVVLKSQSVHNELGSNLTNFVASNDGQVVWAASGFHLLELDPSTLTGNEVVYGPQVNLNPTGNGDCSNL